MRKCKTLLNDGKGVRTLELDADEKKLMKTLGLITAKKVLYVANVDEKDIHGEGPLVQKVRQRAGHGSLEVTSRYAAILDERDTSLADTLEEIFDSPRPAVGGHQRLTEQTSVPRAV